MKDDGSSGTISVPENIYRDERVQKLRQSRKMLRGLDKLVYEYVREAIVAAIPERPNYNPYLYEPLLTDVSRLLDRCLGYRRECVELESLAVRRALEYSLFGELAEQEEKLNNAATDTGALSLQMTAQESAATLFGAADALGKGFEKLSSGCAESIGTAIANEDSKKTALGARLEGMRTHQALLEARHTTPGHALNYVERRERCIRMLVQDLVEAFQKARAARAGLLAQLQLADSPEYGFPKIANTDEDSKFLDQFVLWVRDTVRRYEIDTQDDVVFERVIPLRQPYAYDGKNAGNDKNLAADATFLLKMRDRRDGQFDLANIGQAIPAAYRRVRVRGVGVSAGWPHASRDGEGSSYSWSAVVFLPSQADPYASSGMTFNSTFEVRRSPAVLGRVAVFRSDAGVPMASGEEVWNGSVSDGTVVVLVEPAVIAAGKTGAGAPEVRGVGTGEDKLTDLKLHLRLVATPAKDPAEWRKAF